MNWFCKGFVTLGLALVIAGCGSGGTTAISNTVAVTAGITDGTNGSVFAHYSSLHNGNIVFVASPMSITLTSVAVNTTSKIPASNVTIEDITMTLAPLPYSSYPPNDTNDLSAKILHPQYAKILQGVGGVIPGAGSLSIGGIRIIGPADGAFLTEAFANLKQTDNKLEIVQYHYTAMLVFHCVESNTGVRFTVSEPVGVEVAPYVTNP